MVEYGGKAVRSRHRPETMFLTTPGQIKKALKDKRHFALRYFAHGGQVVILTCTPVKDGKRTLWQAIFNGKANRAPLSPKDMARVASDCILAA